MKPVFRFGLWHLLVFTVLVAGSSVAQTQSSAVSSNTISASTAAPASTKGELPDAPSVARQEQEPAPPPPISRRHKKVGEPVPAGRGISLGGDSKVADWQYFTLTGAMFASSIVNAEYAQKCLDQRTCNAVPEAFRSRVAMYGAGLTADAGVAFLTAYLKSKGKSWWFIPAAAITAGNVYVAHHWATRVH